MHVLNVKLVGKLVVDFLLMTDYKFFATVALLLRCYSRKYVKVSVYLQAEITLSHLVRLKNYISHFPPMSVALCTIRYLNDFFVQVVSEISHKETSEQLREAEWTEVKVTHGFASLTFILHRLHGFMYCLGTEL